MSFGKRKRDEDEDPEILCAKKALELFRYREGFTDAYLLVKGEKLWVNRALVASRSTYFRPLFEGVYKERDEQGVEIHEFPLEDVLMALSFSQVITGRCPELVWGQRDQAASVANVFGVESLFDTLSEMVERRGVVVRTYATKKRWEWALFVLENRLKLCYTALARNVGTSQSGWACESYEWKQNAVEISEFRRLAKSDDDFLLCYAVRHIEALPHREE